MVSRFVVVAALIVGLNGLGWTRSKNYGGVEEFRSEGYDNEESRQRGQFSNLLTAIVRNNLGSIQTLRDSLHQEARQEQRNFEKIKDRLHFARKHGPRNLRSYRESTGLSKRETIENGTKESTISAESHEVHNRTKGSVRDRIFGRTSRASELATEYMQDVGNESKIEWKIKSGTEEVEHGDSQICLTLEVNKTLCQICLEAINKSLSSNGKMRLQEATFMQGTLTFPGTNFLQKFIDILMCTYYPTIGVGRFYLTSGGRAKSAYLINNAGVSRKEHRFTLYGKNFTWN